MVAVRCSATSHAASATPTFATPSCRPTWARTKQDQFGSCGTGSSNLLGKTPQGFDYKFNCPLGFLHNEKPKSLDGDFYQGKWLKPDKKIEILTQQPGSTRVDKCTLDVTLVARPYDRDNPPPDAKN